MKKNYLFKTWVLFCVFSVASLFSANAQVVNTYGFSASSGTYTPLVGATATSLTLTADDAVSTAAAIGFNFVYGGTTFTQFRVNSNGVVYFGATPSSTTATNNLATATLTARPGVAPLWDDLACTAGVTYQLSGVAPNQKLTIEFKSMKWNYNSVADVISFQVILSETTNQIDFVYQQGATAINSGSASIGIMGAAAADYISLQGAGSAPLKSTTVSANSIAIKPATGQVYSWMAAPATPPTPTETAGIANCTSGTNFEIVGSPAAGVTWYVQTTALGTSTANAMVSPYNVMNNGTYYVRAYNSTFNVWSVASSSIVIGSIPVATTPPAPTANMNPSCVTTGSILTAATATAPIVYYWQTVANGISTANDASSTLTAPTTGTYYLSAFDASNSCWSATSSIAVTVNTTIPPAPVIATTNYNICSGDANAPITAAVPVHMSTLTCASSNTVSGTDNTNPSVTVTNFSCPTGTITSANLDAAFTGTYCGSWYNMDIVVNGTTILTGVCTQTNLNLTPYLPLTSVTAIAHDMDSWGDGITLNLNVDLFYSAPTMPQPNYTLTWFDAASAGNNIGTASPLETVGTTVMPVAVVGSFPFYAQTELDGCSSATRGLVTVNVSDVNAVLTPVNATCNGANNGSFTLGTVNCGAEPFMYSVNGSPFDLAIPTDLLAGTYTVIIQDDNMLTSAPITVIVTQPAVPSAITFTNVGYFAADVSWVTTGNETSWNIEYGPVGFTPGTGTTETATASPFTITGLQEDTDYNVYITPVCGTSPQSAGPVVLSTNPGFFTFDNGCGPGFTDISTSGTNLNLADDTEAGITLPWAWTVNGVTVNTVTVGNNGGVLFNTLTGNVGYTSTANGMFPYVQDLDTPTGGVYYQSIGTAPNRQFIIMWNDLAAYGATNGSTFEIIVDEATNDIYYIYDDVEMGSVFDDYGADAEIVLNTANGNTTVSMNDATYLTNNSCVHFYNALCPNAIVTSSTVAQEQIDITWNAGAYGEVEWTVIYGPVGFNPAVSGTTITSMTSNVSITGLTQLTEYDVYIYSECSADNLTSGGLLVNYTTLPWCNTPTALGGSTAVDSIFTTWNYTDVIGAPQPLTGFNIQYGEFGFDLYDGTTVAANGLNYADTVLTSMLAGGVYQVYVQSVCGTDTSGYAGPITVVAPITNNDVCLPQMLNVDGTVYVFNNTGATAQAGEAALITGSNPAGYNGTNLPMMTWGSPTIEGSNWYTFVAPASGSMWFSGSDEDFFGSQIAIYETADCANFSAFQLIGASDQVDTITDNKVAPNFTICGLTPGATYYILHDAWSNGFGGLPNFGQYSIKMTEIVLEAGNYVDVVNACAGATVDLLDGISGYDAGGVWTSTTTNLNQGITGSMFNSAGFAYSQFVFEYTVTEGCAYDTILSQVKIYPPSAAGVDGTITACRNEPIYLLSGLTGVVDLGGQWYNPSNNPTTVNITTSNLPGSFNYDYIVSNGVCPADTSNILVTVGTCDYLDIQELVFGDMKIYPNPTNGLVFISTGSSDVFSYELMDVKGQVLSAKDAAINGASTTEISLEKLEPGIYMIRVHNSDAEKTFRVIKQ